MLINLEWEKKLDIILYILDVVLFKMTINTHANLESLIKKDIKINQEYKQGHQKQINIYIWILYISAYFGKISIK